MLRWKGTEGRVEKGRGKERNGREVRGVSSEFLKLLYIQILYYISPS